MKLDAPLHVINTSLDKKNITDFQPEVLHIGESFDVSIMLTLNISLFN